MQLDVFHGFGPASRGFIGDEADVDLTLGEHQPAEPPADNSTAIGWACCAFAAVVLVLVLLDVPWRLGQMIGVISS